MKIPLGAELTGIWHLAPTALFSNWRCLLFTAHNLYTPRQFQIRYPKWKYVLEHKLTESALYDNIHLTNRKNSHVNCEYFYKTISCSKKCSYCLRLIRRSWWPENMRTPLLKNYRRFPTWKLNVNLYARSKFAAASWTCFLLGDIFRKRKASRLIGDKIRREKVEINPTFSSQISVATPVMQIVYFIFRAKKSRKRNPFAPYLETWK